MCRAVDFKLQCASEGFLNHRFLTQRIQDQPQGPAFLTSSQMTDTARLSTQFGQGIIPSRGKGIKTKLETLQKALMPSKKVMPNPLQYSCLGNPMHREAWRATVHGVVKESDKQLSDQTTTATATHIREVSIFSMRNHPPQFREMIFPGDKHSWHFAERAQ